MNQPIGHSGGMATLPPRGIGEILSAAFQLYRRHWRTLLAIAAVVVVPLTLLQYGAGAWLLQGIAAAVATTLTMPYGALVGVLLYLDLRARKERLDLDTLKADLQASTA
jgi:hypothetical protein